MSVIFFVMMMNGTTEDRPPCGANSLAMCIRQMGGTTAADEIALRLPRGGVDANLSEIKSVAEALGFYCRGVRWPDLIPEGYAPAIVQVVLPTGRTHFIAILEARGNQFLVGENSQSRWVSATMLRTAQWNGVALHVSRRWIDLYVPSQSKLPLVGTGVLIVLIGLTMARYWRLGFRRHSRQIVPTPRPLPNRSRDRDGVTLIEVLVSLAVVGILIALLLPAVQAVRERARTLACANHLRQIGVAMQSFESSYSQFPPLMPNDTQPDFLPWNIRYPVSPHFNLLPYLDAAAIQSAIDLKGDQWDLSSDPPTSSKNAKAMAIRIPVFLCPSDRGAASATNYVMCHGTSTDVHITPSVPVPNSGRDGFARTRQGLRPADVTDGLSMTIAFSERLVGHGDPSVYDPSRDIALLSGLPPPLLPDDGVQMCVQYVTSASPHSSFSGQGWLFARFGGTIYNQILTPNSAIPDCAMGSVGQTGVYTVRSLHQGGCQTLLGDGAVRFVSESIDQTVWRALGTVNSSDRAEWP